MLSSPPSLSKNVPVNETEIPMEDMSQGERAPSASSVGSKEKTTSGRKDVGAVLGKGKYLLYAGLALMTVIYELDNSTVTSYQTYAAFSFNKLPMLAMLETAGSILMGICKPPIAKLSDVVGRGETYILMVLLYVLSYIICASAASFSAYVGGCVLYAIAQSGTGMLNSVLVSDFSSMRWRGLSWNLMYLPFLITACVSAFIVNSVVHRIGWRWGIGMFGMLMPISASLLIIMLLVFERRARKTGLILTEGCPSLYEFCSRIDLGGVGLLSGGFAMLLIPITMAATTSHQWKTPWINALIGTGGLALALFYPYEKYCARHPVVPVEYFQNPPIIIGVLMGCIDTISFSATHTYLYPWSMVAHNLSPRDAQFLVYTNGIMQCVIGMVTGVIMYKLRTYKWLGFAGSLIRLVGYAVMIRFRTNTSSLAELFIVQIIQGLGSGVIETVIIVAAQIVVPQAQLAQVTSLVLLGNFLGYAIGSSVAGAIYTGTLTERLKVRLGSDWGVDSLRGSITGTLPTWGTNERNAVNQAYSDVIGYITYAAMAMCIPVIVLALLMPDERLGDGPTLHEIRESPNPTLETEIQADRTGTRQRKAGFLSPIGPCPQRELERRTGLTQRPTLDHHAQWSIQKKSALQTEIYA